MTTETADAGAVSGEGAGHGDGRPVPAAAAAGAEREAAQSRPDQAGIGGGRAELAAARRRHPSGLPGRASRLGGDRAGLHRSASGTDAAAEAAANQATFDKLNMPATATNLGDRPLERRVRVGRRDSCDPARLCRCGATSPARALPGQVTAAGEQQVNLSNNQYGNKIQDIADQITGAYAQIPDTDAAVPDQLPGSAAEAARERA